ncbi:protein IMPACT-like isoform X1 [Mizuhopecten yessoensis]|uniref:Protein IMPACT n=1 Tax=Mizuhopecten yessoensis TaxID=6573 RepID=A0A210QJE4_MIZYE|nr:protein IMPACT-like isoform X1 [Mizuhopecten yessoensis]OWF48806.1 Protein IMPACT [Mizuhopecten yessoensis]
MSDDASTRQEEEVEALAAIYGDDWCVVSEQAHIYSIQVRNEDPKSHRTINVEITMPPGYPTESPPLYQLTAPWLRREEKQTLEDSLADIYCENLGESMIYLWIERIREVVQAQLDNSQSDSSPQTSQSASAVRDEDENDGEFDLSDLVITTIEQPDDGEVMECPPINSGEPIVDRRSTFQGHLAPVVHKKQVKQILDTLYQNKKIANATHNIYAYRICQGGTVYQGCEDDGETNAGSRMLHLLQILDSDNVMVVVSRWYGGILLGPDRFKHINNAARGLLEEHGYIKSKESKKGPKSGGKKKR